MIAVVAIRHDVG